MVRKRFPDSASEQNGDEAISGPEHVGQKNRRRYVRLNSVLPVELQLFDVDTHVQLTEVLQGYSQDVSEGGLCVEVLRFSAQHRLWMSDNSLRLRLVVYLPTSRTPLSLTGRMAWMEDAPELGVEGVRFGVAFDAIDAHVRTRLMRYARHVHWLPRVVTVSFAMLVMTIGGMSWQHHAGNHLLNTVTHQLYELADRETQLQDQLATIQAQQAALEIRLAEAQRIVRNRKKTPVPFGLGIVEAAIATPMLPVASAEAPIEITAMQHSLASLTEQNDATAAELTRVTSTKTTLEHELLDSFFQWLSVHQHPDTGLVISYEGDSALEDWGFSYDQALMVQVFALFEHQDRAAQILQFYSTRAERVEGAFANAYDAVSGAVREYVIHAGPNIWLGVAAAQYQYITGDTQFLPLATSIASWLIRLQSEDGEGGIRGGPHVSWYSTEHNLDAHALFLMLHALTGDARYQVHAHRIGSWLAQYAHGALAGQVNRGRGDATIATDTFAWAIAALQPAQLQRMGFDPDHVMAFAEEHCKVKVQVTRQDGLRVAVEGFDFSKPKHLARGGIVSTEWTGQMIAAYHIMEDFHRTAKRTTRADAYHAKAKYFMHELKKLMIHSPCPMGHLGWALPYASHANIDTGHGWRTASGNVTGSTSATAYAIFAQMRFNPLQLQQLTTRTDTVVVPRASTKEEVTTP